jgi:hypothetical protein
MADAAKATMEVTVLPDEIAKTFSATTTVTPEDVNDKWYYKLSSVDNTSSDLIAGSFVDYTAVDSSTAPDTVDVADLAKFVFIKNVDGNNGTVYVTFDGTVATSTNTSAVAIGPNESHCGRYPNATVADINAISSTGTVEVIVCALLDDVA